ncbi:MAG: hypothetical protein IT380_09035 [Myxococcales bacterium]|nr:hypothetical protein [Myxococcales bacterium]
MVILVFAGCRSGFSRTVHEPRQPFIVSSVVVYPVRLTGTRALGWREFELGQRLVDAGLAKYGGQLAFFGPSEFQVTKWQEVSWTASTVVPQVIRSGHKPDEAVVLRATAERRVASSAMERRDADDKAKGGIVTEEVTWVCELELLRPSTGEVLVNFAGQVAIDPFTPTGEEEFDPDAAMTHLLEKMGLAALKVAASALAEDAPEAKASPVTLAMSPAVTAAQPDTGLSSMDALAAEVWVQNRVRFLTPRLPEDQVSAAARMPLGLLVVEAQDGASVQPGDVIVRVDDQPPLPQVLARARLKGVPVQVTVKRGGAQVEALIP